MINSKSPNRDFVSFATCLVPIIACALLLLGGCTTLSQSPDTALVVAATNSDIEYSGRNEVTNGGQVTIGYSGARARLRFLGSSVAVRLSDDSGENYAMAWVDGQPLEKFRLDSPSGVYPLADGLGEGEHTVEVMRITECFIGLSHFRGFEIGGNAKTLPWQGRKDRKIEFIGDSITCGYGVEAEDPNLPFEAATENFSVNYSSLAARELDADFLVVARSGIGMVRNYDGPYEGSQVDMPEVYSKTFYENQSYDWDFSRFVPDVVCINLGTNDFSTTGVNVETYVSDYVSFAKGVLGRYPEAELVMILGPMNNSEELKAAIHRVLSQLKEVEPDRVHFKELSPQGSLGFGASYHPNRAQSKLNAEELSRYLSDLMDWK